jgi:hypothetical protein
MKLNEMSNDELKQAIDKLQRESRHALDKYKRWEAQQKLKLAQSEQRKRGRFKFNGLVQGIKQWLGN